MSSNIRPTQTPPFLTWHHPRSNSNTFLKTNSPIWCPPRPRTSPRIRVRKPFPNLNHLSIFVIYLEFIISCLPSLTHRTRSPPPPCLVIPRAYRFRASFLFPSVWLLSYASGCGQGLFSRLKKAFRAPLSGPSMIVEKSRQKAPCKKEHNPLAFKPPVFCLQKQPFKRCRPMKRASCPLSVFSGAPLHRKGPANARATKQEAKELWGDFFTNGPITGGD